MTKTPPYSYTPQEIAYRDERGNWKRTVCKTQRGFERFLAKLNERGAELVFRDADGAEPIVTKQTAGNNDFLRAAKAHWNKPIYARVAILVNESGEAEATRWLAQFKAAPPAAEVSASDDTNNACEICGIDAGEDYYSDPRCNATAFGVVLCAGCADRCDALDDAAFDELANDTIEARWAAARKLRFADALDTFCRLALESDLSDEQLTHYANFVVNVTYVPAAAPAQYVAAFRAMPAAEFAERVKRACSGNATSTDNHDRLPMLPVAARSA